MSPSEQIDKMISATDGWKGTILKELRELILETNPEIKEEWKWDVPVFAYNGMICAISAFKDHVKINFFKGAQLKDTHNVINGGLESKNHRSIDFFEGDKINKQAVSDLIKQAVSLNTK